MIVIIESKYQSIYPILILLAHDYVRQNYYMVMLKLYTSSIISSCFPGVFNASTKFEVKIEEMQKLSWREYYRVFVGEIVHIKVIANTFCLCYQVGDV